MPTKRKTKKTASIKIIGYTRGKRHKNSIPFLHEEVILNILSRLPSNCLHGIMRYVSNTWADIICNPHFVETHLQRLKPGLVIQNEKRPYALRFVEFKEEDRGVHVTDLQPCSPGKILGSCDGVLLFSRADQICQGGCTCGRPCCFHIYVANPNRMLVTQLPAFHPDKLIGFPYDMWCVIARVPNSGKFKLVCGHPHPIKGTCWYVLRVGIDDSWREIGSLFTDIIMSRAASTPVGQFVYWTDTKFAFKRNEVIVTDIVNESVYTMSIPAELGKLIGVAKIGDYLASVTYSGIGSSPDGLYFRGYFDGLNIHLLKDVGLGNWEFYQKVPFSSPNARNVMWFTAELIGSAGHELMFRTRVKDGPGIRGLVTYNLRTRKIRCCGCELFGIYEFLHVHTNSLVMVSL